MNQYFRFDYIKYDSLSEANQLAFKKAFEDLEKMVNQLADGRAKSLVFTKIEEAYMWVGKAIRDEQVARYKGTKLNESRG